MPKGKKAARHTFWPCNGLPLSELDDVILTAKRLLVPIKEKRFTRSEIPVKHFLSTCLRSGGYLDTHRMQDSGQVFWLVSTRVPSTVVLGRSQICRGSAVFGFPPPKTAAWPFNTMMFSFLKLKELSATFFFFIFNVFFSKIVWSLLTVFTIKQVSTMNRCERRMTQQMHTTNLVVQEARQVRRK